MFVAREGRDTAQYLIQIYFIYEGCEVPPLFFGFRRLQSCHINVFIDSY